MSQMGKVLAGMGVLPPEAVKQFQRWGNPAVAGIDAESIPTEAAPIEQVVVGIDQVLQDKASVEVRETDLDVLKQFKDTRTEAVLHIEDEEGQSADVAVEVGRLRTGEFVFPWSSEGIEEVMTNGFTGLHFNIKPGDPLNSPGITFSDVRELYFGEDKTFMVCTPRRK